MGYPFRTEILAALEAHQDVGYRDFQSKLIPSIDPSTMMGVRTPDLRKLAKQMARRPDVESFLSEVPHQLFEENQLHAFIVSGIRDYDEAIRQLERFLPAVDNWATCDQMSCKVLATQPGKTLEHVQSWLASDQVYTIRFGIGVLLQFFLGEHFDPLHLEWVTAIQHDDYYVNMMRAWYYAEALAKQEASTLAIIESEQLDLWTHNKAIQKAIESRRIPPDLKTHLRNLRRRKSR